MRHSCTKMYVVWTLVLLFSGSYGLFVPSLINLRRNCGAVAQKPNHIFKGISPCQTGRPIVENAQIMDTFRDEKGRLALNVVCECGALFPDGTTTRTIHNVRAEWIVTEHCIIPTCTVPSISNAVLTPPSGTVNYMGSLSVTCNAEHILPSDDSASYVSVCLPDGSWTRTESCVEILDCVPPALEHATITGGPFSYNDEMTVTCDDGYKLCDGTNEYTAKCHIDGTWNTTDCCTPVVCAAEDRSNTKLKDGRLPDLSYPVLISVQCDDRYRTSALDKSYEAACTSNANWNFTEDCTFDTTCGEVAVSNTMLTDDVLPMTADGASVTVQCEGDLKVVGMEEQTEYTATCTAGQWDTILSCGFLDCIDVRERIMTSGLYTIYPDGNTAINTYCLGKNTLIQSRYGDDTIGFDEGWNVYVDTFGQPSFRSTDFWIGLENLHILTSRRSYALFVGWNQPAGFNNYASFSIGDASTNYTLHVSGYTSGNGGDSLTYHDGQQFTTKDRDNDENTDDNCAVQRGGGWWFKDCQGSNLNGKRGVDSEMGIIWATSSAGPTTSLPNAEMWLNPPT